MNSRRFGIVSLVLTSWMSSVLFAQAPAETESELPPIEELYSLFESAYRMKEYDKALDAGKKLAIKEPENAEIAYNNACVCALKGDKAEALKWLKKSTDNGMAEFGLITTDPDLVSLRNEAEFVTAVEAVRKHRAKAFEELKTRVAATQPKVVIPEDLDPSKPAPLLVLLHGFGDREDGIVDQWRDIAALFKVIIVSPRAPHATINNGFQWGDVEDAEYVVEKAIASAKQKHSIDEKRVIISGFSQGGAMAFNLGLRNPGKFFGVIPIAGSFQPDLAAIPPGSTATKPRVYILVGDRDPVLGSNQKAVSSLEAAGVPVRMEVLENTTHTYPKDRVTELRKAMEYVFGH